MSIFPTDRFRLTPASANVLTARRVVRSRGPTGRATTSAWTLAFVLTLGLLGMALAQSATDASSDTTPQLDTGPDLGPDLDYGELLDLAEASPSVDLARRSLEQAERQAAARGFPIQLTGSAGYGRTSGEFDPGGGAPVEDLGEGDIAPIALGLRFDPFVYGAGADDLQRARAGVEQARTALEGARRRARIDAVSAFQDALAAARSLDIAAAEARLAEQERAAARERLAAGAASDLALAQADLAAARASQARGAAERQAELAIRALAIVVGRDVPPPTGPLPAPAGLPDRSAVTVSERADVQDALAAVDDADRTYDATVRDALPTVTLDASWLRGDDASTFQLGGSIASSDLAPSIRASYDVDDGPQGVLADDGSLDRFEISLSLDFVFSPAIGDALAVVRLSQEQARAQSDAVRRSADLAVEQAWVAALAAHERIRLAEDALDLAQRSADVTRLRIDAGAAAPVAGERAALDVRRAEADVIAATDAYRIALFRLLDAAAVPPEDLE